MTLFLRKLLDFIVFIKDSDEYMYQCDWKKFEFLRLLFQCQTLTWDRTCLIFLITISAFVTQTNLTLIENILIILKILMLFMIINWRWSGERTALDVMISYWIIFQAFTMKVNVLSSSMFPFPCFIILTCIPGIKQVKIMIWCYLRT